MLNYFIGEVVVYQDKKILKNQYFGIEIIYLGNQTSGEFFLYPVFDQNNNTYVYYAFDNMQGKVSFETMNKLPGIGPKTAYNISMIPNHELKQAIDDFNIKFFQSIPGIGPKTAKRILVELKGTFDEDDMSKLNIDTKLYNDIISSLGVMGYEKSKIKKAIQKCPEPMTQDNLSQIIKRIITNVK